MQVIFLETDRNRKHGKFLRQTMFTELVLDGHKISHKNARYL